MAVDPSGPFRAMESRDARMRDLYDGLLQLLGPTIVCDVGAFNGDETQRFSSLLPKSKIVAFEASAGNIDRFWRNAPWVRGRSNVRLEHMAVTDSVGQVSFHVLEPDADTAWRAAANSLLARADDTPYHEEVVDATTLDDYFSRELELQETFALWIDVEGALDKVLSGAAGVLSRTMILRAEIEHRAFWQGQALAPELHKMIREAGFARLGDTFLPSAYEQSDVLYIREDVLELLP